jgi:hypothetical protein
MTTIRRIPTSKIDGNNSNATDTDEIRPFGEIAVYIDTSGSDDKLTLMMFDGERTHLKSKVLAAGVVYGSDADSGDGNNRDTIKLIPDAELHRAGGDYDNDQYLIIDPTDPGHIHIRAGGSMDNSNADLFLGGEKNNVRVSDTSDRVAITADAGEGGIKTWLFDGGGALTLPNSGIITADFNGGPTAPLLTLRLDSPEEGAAQINLAVDNNSINVDNNGVGIGVGSNNWYFTSEGQLTFPDTSVQTTAYAGGVGRAMMIDTNRTDTYTEVGSADRPFKTFAAAIAAAEESEATAYTFILMGCTVTENVDFGGTAFTQITISTTCRSVITGNVTINNNSDLSQLVVRNIEIGGTFTLAGDGTANQMNSCSFYNVSFTGVVNITATNASAFYEVSFFNTVNFTNLSYLYINGAQFNTDWTITADSDGVIPSRGINPGTGGSIAIVFSVIANNVIFVKGGTAAYVFQPHMSRMGLGAGTYTVPAGWTMTPHSTVLRGTWINNGTVAMRNSSSDLAITGVARSYTGIIGGDRVVADLVPANSTGAAGDAAGMIAVGGGYLYVCTANWASPGTADIWTRTTLTTGAW